MTAGIPRRLSPDEHMEIEGGFADLHEYFPRAIDPDDVYWMLNAHERGASVPAIAKHFKVSPHAVAHVITCNTPGPRCVPASEPFGRAAKERPLTVGETLFWGGLVLIGYFLPTILGALVRLAVH